jgi:hypothetical protein
VTDSCFLSFLFFVYLLPHTEPLLRHILPFPSCALAASGPQFVCSYLNLLLLLTLLAAAAAAVAVSSTWDRLLLLLLAVFIRNGAFGVLLFLQGFRAGFRFEKEERRRRKRRRRRRRSFIVHFVVFGFVHLCKCCSSSEHLNPCGKLSPFPLRNPVSASRTSLPRGSRWRPSSSASKSCNNEGEYDKTGVLWHRKAAGSAYIHDACALCYLLLPRMCILFHPQ